MEDICRELDEVTLELFENLERLQEKRASLCAALRDGHLNLSKARYSMGNKSVGALQYSHQMHRALYHIDLEEIQSNNQSDSNKRSEDTFTTLQLAKDLPGVVMATDDKRDEEKMVLRRRKPQKSDGVKDISDELSGIEYLNISQDTLGNESVKGSKVQDPIKWFGILVPGCLRTGQKNFQSAIELSCELVNLENKQREIITKFKDLKGQKNALVSETTETADPDVAK